MAASQGKLEEICQKINQSQQPDKVIDLLNQYLDSVLSGRDASRPKAPVKE